MKITALLMLFAPLAFAQEVSPEVQAKLNALDAMIVAFAQELAQDPRLEVTETQETIQVKPRTPETIDKVDPKEPKRVENIQGLFNFSIGKGTTYVSKTNLNMFAPNGANTIDRNSLLHFDLAVRPPVRALKRLLLGVGLELENAGAMSAAKGTHTIARGGDQEINEIFFANWDVLILHRARAIVSTGYHYGSYTMLDLSDGRLQQTYDKEHAAQLRWSQIIYSSKDKNYPGDTGSEAVGYYAQVRYSKNRTASLNFGMTISAGADWPWMKKIKTK